MPWVTAGNSKPEIDNKANVSSKPSRKKKVVLTSSVIFGLALAGYFIFFQGGFFLDRADDRADNSVAVLAFDDLSSQHDQEWFSDGLTEEISNSLANLRELKVTARTSSFYFKGKGVSLSEISRKLGVAHLVEGSVQKIGDRLRITVQLIRASDEFHVWSQRYDRDYVDLFKVQAEIAESIAQKLLHELTPEKREKLATTKPATLHAYEYYLKGCKTHYDKFIISGTSADFTEAERCLLKAISLDPTYAESYGALADLYDARSNRQELKNRYATMRDSVVRVGYKLNPTSLQMLLAYGYSWRKRREPNLDSAFHFFKKAYLISPDDPMVCYGLAYFYRTIGLNSEALKFSSRYLKSNPMSASAYADLAGSQLNLGNYAEAKINCEKAIQISGDYVRALFLLGTISIMNGDVKLAQEQIEKIRQIDHAKGSGTAEFLEATLDASQGQRTQAIKGFLPSLRLMALLGMKSEFLARLDSFTSLPIPSPTFSPEPTGLKNDKLFDLVRNEPQFKIICDRVSRMHNERMTKYGSLE